MFNIEVSSDILIIAVFIQMAIIAILIFTVFFKLNKINLRSSTTSATKNTELDKNLEKKLTGIQIRLNEILTEISTATKEQKESLSKVATTVTAAPDSIASGVIASIDTSTGTAANAAAAATTTTTAISSETSISSPTSIERFPYTAFTPQGITASSANTSAAIYTNPTKFISGLFDRSDHTYSSRSEFLDIDLDDGSSDTPNSNLDGVSSKLQDQDNKVTTTNTNTTNVIRAISDAPTDMSDSIASSDSNSYQGAETSSRHNHYHPLTHNYLNQRQDTYLAQSEFGNRFHEPDRTIRRNKEFEDINSNRREVDVFQNQNGNNEKNDFENKKFPSSSSEKNSNPELDKVDEEILTALQRLGGIDDSDNDKDSSNDNIK